MRNSKSIADKQTCFSKNVEKMSLSHRGVGKCHDSGVAAFPKSKAIQLTDLYQILHAYQTVNNLQYDGKETANFDKKL